MYSPRFALWAVGEDRRLAALTIAEQVEALVRTNMHLRRAFPDMPTLAQAQIPYKDDSRLVCNGSSCHYVEGDWQDWKVTLDRGYADCKVFVAEEVAEFRLKGIGAWPLPRCYDCAPRKCPTCWNPMRGGKETWHVQTLHADGRISDPSRERGMRPHPHGDDAVVAQATQVGVIRRIGW